MEKWGNQCLESQTTHPNACGHGVTSRPLTPGPRFSQALLMPVFQNQSHQDHPGQPSVTTPFDVGSDPACLDPTLALAPVLVPAHQHGARAVHLEVPRSVWLKRDFPHAA